MVDEVEMTEALPSLADDGSGGACVEAARFGSSIGNGDGHGEGVTVDRLSSLKCTPWLRAESRDLVVSKKWSFARPWPSYVLSLLIRSILERYS